MSSAAKEQKHAQALCGSEKGRAYAGDDYEADMAKMAADPETQRWWDECIPCLDPYTEDGPWLDMERVYRLD